MTCIFSWVIFFWRTCKDSSDSAFADCAVPQEKSNAEINAELGLSDASGEEDAYEGSKNFKELEYRPPFGMLHLLASLSLVFYFLNEI